MRKLALCFAVLLFFAVSGVAQDMGQSSSSDASASSTKAKKSKWSKMGGEHQVTGCLAGPNDEGVYTLTNGKYTKGLEVGGNDELKSHVGHQVKLTGTWANAADIGEKEPAGEKKENEKAEKHLKVSSIKMVSDSCPAHAAKKGHKKEKAAPTT